MSGETDLAVLLRDMQPILDPADYVFVSVAAGTIVDLEALQPRGMYLEEEGTTLILRHDVAVAHGFGEAPVMRCITLSVHSSLQAVGLTAAFSTALAKGGCSANVVAGYYHDHIFVAADEAGRAMEILTDLSKGEVHRRD